MCFPDRIVDATLILGIKMLYNSNKEEAKEWLATIIMGKIRWVALSGRCPSPMRFVSYKEEILLSKKIVLEHKTNL